MSKSRNSVDVSSLSLSEDDEEALKWAAIARLPTYDRLKKGLLVGSRGEASEIDIRKLGVQEKMKMMERLIRNADEDNEMFLLKLKNRLDRVGIKIPTIEVRFEHLKVDTEVHVGSRALPTLSNFFADIVESFLNYLHVLPSRKEQLHILNDVSGMIKPGRMTLLLGPPASGKTTLLLALARLLDPELNFSGRVTYNGHEMNEFVPPKSAAYISQHDLHIGEMTVRETLAFAARCHGVGTQYEMLAELVRREKAANILPDPDLDMYMKSAATEGQETSITVDYALKILGLEVCADTMVGDATLRGISGGQKKRVTIGEMLVGPAKVLLMDEISTGLDSSTTFQVVNALKRYVHILNGTALISLLQPATETYELFDDVVLLSDGHIVYQGPREHVLEFFESMGFHCPERKGVADFLQEVTSKKDQEQYWARVDQPYSYVTVKQFVEAFKSFHVGLKLRDELAIPFDKSRSHPAALTTKEYGVKKRELLKACMSREYLLMKRNSFVYLFKLFQLAITAFIAMTVFPRTELHRDSATDGLIVLGSLFFTLHVMTVNGFSEISMAIQKLPTFFKQRKLLFYPAWAYAFPILFLSIPVTIIEVAVWVFPSYYVIGYDPNVGGFFKQYLILVLLKLTISALFRFVGVAFRHPVVANLMGSYVLALLFILGGYLLSRENVKKWWIWMYWLNPLMYAQNATAVNEFLGNSWRNNVPINSSEPLGVVVLKSSGLFPYAYWYWTGVGATIGFMFLSNFLFILALTYRTPFGKRQVFVSKETLRDNYGNGTGVTNQLSYQGGGQGPVGDIVLSERRNEVRKKGLVLPFEQHSITFDEIRYSVDMPQEIKYQGVEGDKLKLLQGVSGAFRPGVLTALMGVSGAGKTTLMDVLAGRKTGGYIEGNIKVSGYPKKKETFARICGYCEQNDIHSPNVTVYESLIFSAWLRLPPEVNSETRMLFIEEVMELVELSPLREAIVGLPGVSGLSMEQRKRLTIAVELVANPSIIFMDEPTTGLDARAAAIVMRTVRSIADTGRTVVCTIHQPSIDIFESFDELFLMARGGQEIYVGPLGRHSCDLINYFEGIEGVSKIEDGYNPATWMLEVTTSAEAVLCGINFSEVYKNSDLYRRNKILINKLSKPAAGSKDLYFKTQYSQSFLNQFKTCLWKQHRSYLQNPSYNAVRILSMTFVGLMFGSLFWDLGSKWTLQHDLHNAMGSMFECVVFLGITNAFSVQPVVAIERIVFYRERAAGMYSAFAYSLAQATIEVPYVFVQAMIFGLIIYSLIQFKWTAAKCFWFLFYLYFTGLCYTFYGMVVVAITPNQRVASVISGAIYALWTLFSGLMIPRPRIPVWWRWYSWLSPIAWTLYGLIASQFGDVEDKLLDSNETVEQFLRSYYGFRHDFVGVAAAVLVGFTLLFALMFAFSIKLFNFQRR